MPRMSAVEPKKASWSARLIYWLARRRLGHVPEGTKILAHDPLLLRGWTRMTERRSCGAVEAAGDAEDGDAGGVSVLN